MGKLGGNEEELACIGSKCTNKKHPDQKALSVIGMNNEINPF